MASTDTTTTPPSVELVETVPEPTERELLLAIAENTAAMRAVLEGMGAALEGVAAMFGQGGNPLAGGPGGGGFFGG